MNTEQERADFEAWMRDNHPGHCLIFVNGYLHKWPQRLWEAYQAGRAALQSQDAEDAERYRWLRDGGNDDIGVVRGFGCIDSGSTTVVGTFEEGLYGEQLDAAIDHARRIERQS